MSKQRINITVDEDIAFELRMKRNFNISEMINNYLKSYLQMNEINIEGYNYKEEQIKLEELTKQKREKEIERANQFNLVKILREKRIEQITKQSQAITDWEDSGAWEQTTRNIE